MEAEVTNKKEIKTTYNTIQYIQYIMVEYLMLHSHSVHVYIYSVSTHRWFTEKFDPDTNTSYHVFDGQYWDAKLNKDYTVCPDIF